MSQRKTESDGPLPPGWAFGQNQDRRTQTQALPVAVRRLLAAVWAERSIADAKMVLPIFERRRPSDGRPRAAIAAAERMSNLIIANPRAYAADAANAAANAAYAAYAANAAYAAADAAYAAYAANAADAANAAAYAAADAAYAAYAADAANAAANAAYAANAAARWRWFYRTFLACRGPAGAVFSPALRTGTVVSLVRGIVADRAMDRMPILADALEEAGCDLYDELARLRDGGDDLTCADWFVWNALNYGSDE